MTKPVIELTKEGRRALSAKLQEIGFMFIALHDLAASDRGADGRLDQVLAIMAEAFAKRGVRIIDAIDEKLGLQARMGNWEHEFEEEEETAEGDAAA